MNKRSLLLTARLLPVAAIISGLSGCGGGSGTGPGSVDTGGSRVSPDVTALFHVDVKTGQITVTPSKSSTGRAQTRSVFGGTAVGFNSSVLLDQPGSVGVKTLSVTITNNWALPIGVTPSGTASGLRVMFSNFTNVSAFSDPRPRTNVQTIGGNGLTGSTDGQSLSASFNAPTGVAATGGAVYITDKTGNQIRKLAGGQVTTLAGSGAAGGTNGLGRGATFNFPWGIAVNPTDGALIVTELLGNRIRRITSDGRVTTIAGTGTAGGADGAGNVATFNGPAGVTVDSNGRIFVCEYSGHRVRALTFFGGDPAVAASYRSNTVAGAGVAGDVDGVGTAAAFNQPSGIAVDPSGTVYITDQANNAIRRISQGGEVATIAGTGAASSVDGLGNSATFNAPRGIAYVNGALIVADRVGNKIRQLTLTSAGSASPANPTSWQVASLAGTGVSGGADGTGDVATINQPQLITADQSGNLYVPDANNKIRELTPASGSFPIGLATGSAPAEPVQLSNADGVLPRTGDGTNLPYITYTGSLAAGATSAAKNWWFVVPQGVTAFEFTATVEAETSGLVPPTGGTGASPSDSIVRTLAGITNTTAFNDGLAVQARMGLMKYCSIDSAGNVYATDLSNNALRRITPAGQVSTIVGGPGNVATPADGSGANAKVGSINAVAVSPDGLFVYFGDSNTVRVASIGSGVDQTDAGNWAITTLGGTVSAGNTDGVLNTSTFNTIEDMVLDSAGNLYLTEFFGNRIRKIIYKGGGRTDGTRYLTSTFAGDNSATNGASGNTDSTGTSARFFNPRGIAVDRNGNLFVADQSNFRIRKITPEGVVTTVAGTTQGYADGAGGVAQFSLAYGICVDSSGFIYVGDIGSFTVRRISPSGVVSTVAGLGQTSGVTDGPGNVARFVRPAGLAVSPSGSIYVCDQSSMRLVQRLVNTGTQ